ncbi:MAG TPA: 1,4-beta-xylanase [Prolixibacteraceae bacterium]|jgi:acetyl esterase/lipase|nr:1,4-beta-xylanase [Prolixibacteraceae bacterium]
MKTNIYSLLISILFPIFALAQPQSQLVPLWEMGAPGFENRKDIPEQAQDYWVKSINNPSLTVFKPTKEKANGCAVVVCPGGGFRELVFDAEGIQAAQFLNSIGVTVFVLKYRLPQEKDSPYTPENVQQDAHRAMRLIRSRAAEFNIDPNRVGMLGFSAGGAVIMMVAFDSGDGDPSAPDKIDRLNGRPNFQMLVYPGGTAPEAISADAPPAFLICANDDEYGCDEVTMDLLQKFRAANVPVEAIFLAKGKHAFNMGNRSPLVTVNTWPQRMADWLTDSGFLKQ